MKAQIGQIIDYKINEKRKDGSMFIATIKATVFSIGDFIKLQPADSLVDSVTGITILGVNDVININPLFFNY